MICSVSEGATEAVVTCASLDDASTSLQNALDQLAATGMGECYWPEGVGEYRWVFRRVNDKVRVAVLWSGGTITGWEHVFWGETDLERFVAEARGELARVAAAAEA